MKHESRKELSPPEERALSGMDPSRVKSLLEAYVAPEKANELALAAHEDMQSIGFPLREARFSPPFSWEALGVIPQAEYALPDNQFDLNSKIGAESLEGSFLTCGNLLRLGQTAIVGRRFLPLVWPSSFASRLLRREHLDALNEIWWLKFWRGIQRVQPGPKECRSAPDFEWQIEIQNALARCTINLEVKRRPGNINQFFKTGRPSASVRKIARKFGETSDEAANIAAITIYHNVSPEVDRFLRTWLDCQKHLHGLLIWTEGHFEGPPLKKFIKESHRWVEFLLEEPEPEDLKVAGRSAGTLCNPEDVPRFLEKLARDKETVRIRGELE